MYKLLATSKSSLLLFSSHIYIYMHADDCTCPQINFFFVVNNAVIGAVVLALSSLMGIWWLYKLLGCCHCMCSKWLAPTIDYWQPPLLNELETVATIIDQRTSGAAMDAYK